MIIINYIHILKMDTNPLNKHLNNINNNDDNDTSSQTIKVISLISILFVAVIFGLIPAF